MIGKKSSAVPRSSMANRRQVKISVPQNRRSKVGVKSKSSHSNAAAQPKNHLAWYVALDSKPFQKKTYQIPQVKWKCPPNFALNTEWCVAAGERSQEAEAQKCRETKVPEIVFPHLSSFPPSPSSPPDTEGEFCGNIPVIPTVPIEEKEETTFDTSTSGNHPLHLDRDESLRDLLHGLESGDMEVAAAAAATVAAVMESKENIDTELLVKFLTDPEMIKKLIDKKGLRPEPVFVNTPGSTPKSPSPPPPSSTPASVIVNTPGSIPNTLSPPPSSTPASVIVNTPGSIPNTLSPPPTSTPASIIDKITSEPSKPLCPTVPTLSRKCMQGGMNVRSAPLHTSKSVTNSFLPPRFRHSEVAHPDICHTSGVKQVKPMIIPSISRPDEETISRLVNKYRPPCLNPPPSIPNTEAIKKMINQYGEPEMEECRKPNLGLGHPFSGHRPLSGTALAMPPPIVNLNTGNFQFSPFPCVNVPSPPPADLNYFKSLIKQHGQNHQTKEVSEFARPGNFVQGLRLGHNATSIEMNQRYPKPCVYFNSLKGCKNGDKCLYWHNAGVVEAPLAKRMRFG